MEWLWCVGDGETTRAGVSDVGWQAEGRGEEEEWGAEASATSSTVRIQGRSAAACDVAGAGRRGSAAGEGRAGGGGGGTAGGGRAGGSAYCSYEYPEQSPSSVLREPIEGGTGERDAGVQDLGGTADQCRDASIGAGVRGPLPLRGGEDAEAGPRGAVLCNEQLAQAQSRSGVARSRRP